MARASKRRDGAQASLLKPRLLEAREHFLSAGLARCKPAGLQRTQRRRARAPGPSTAGDSHTMPKGLSRSTQGHANRATEPNGPPTTKAADEAEVLPQLKEAGVALGSDGSYQLTTDSFKFREHLKRTMKRDDARDELIQGLADSWEDASSLRQALSPMGAAAAAGDGVKDSLVRCLLYTSPSPRDRG